MRLVFYQSFSKNNLQLFKLTHNNHISYANTHEYSLLCDDSVYSPLLDTNKIRHLLGIYDMVATVGSDCVFTNFSKRISDYIPSDRPVAACIEGTSSTLFNGEILLIRSSSESIKWLDNLDKLQKEFSNHKWGFQYCLNQMKINNLPGNESLYAIPAGTLQHYLAGPKRFEPFKWKKGDFLMHSLTGSLQEKCNYCKTALDQVVK